MTYKVRLNSVKGQPEMDSLVNLRRNPPPVPERGTVQDWFESIVAECGDQYTPARAHLYRQLAELHVDIDDWAMTLAQIELDSKPELDRFKVVSTHLTNLRSSALALRGKLGLIVSTRDRSVPRKDAAIQAVDARVGDAPADDLID